MSVDSIALALLVWLCVFALFGLVSFTYAFLKGRQGAYREKLWDARRELEDGANSEFPDVRTPHAYQPKPNTLNPRPPGDE